jgi:hypothetical protein
MKTATPLCLIVCMVMALAACGGGNDSNGGTGKSCGGGDGDAKVADFSTPKGCLEALDAAYEAKDIDRIVACFRTDDVQKLKDELGGKLPKVWDAGGYMRLAYDEADLKVDGEKAEIRAVHKIKLSKDAAVIDDPEGIYLENEGGEWKVVRR